MDGLALLCNLHADGPVTLKRLRLARIASLGELERTPPERLAEWLHASVPQARTFLDEARRLGRRLAEETPAAAPRHVGPVAPAALQPGRAAGGAAPAFASPPLRPGLLPGLDETVCTRLQLQNVLTAQALSERAGLDLARRTGIPYSTLLELARAARRLGGSSPRPAPPLGRATALPEYELQPFLALPRRAPSEPELSGTDGFTLPPGEPESAGPFG